ncbi:mechanosensitive ion channel family protein [Dysgonomonas sp.]
MRILNKHNCVLKYVFLLLLYACLPVSMSSQNNAVSDKIFPDTAIQSRHHPDSLLIQELMMQIQEMKMNEIILANEKENKNKSDSLKKADQIRRIDSLRKITAGSPVIIERDTLFSFYARRGGVMPADRAERTKEMILSLGKKLVLKPDSLHIFNSEYVTDIMSGNKVILSLTDEDALWQNTTREELVNSYLQIISKQVSDLHAEYGLQQKIKSVLLLVLIIISQIGLIYLTNKLFKRIRIRIGKLANEKLKSISLFNYEFLNNEKQERILVFVTNVLKYAFIFLQLIISLSFVFSIFPETEEYAFILFSYIWNPVKNISGAIIGFFPNLLKIAIIYYVFKYMVRSLKYLANEIAAEKLKINGFYPDWALSTYHILRFLLYCFMLIMIWPLLPNSSSPVFQGVSVFIGLIISLGSTSVIGNLMAGLVITYMRAFKIGDQIKLNDTVGNVTEKTPFVTRIRTAKNDVITIPNSFVLSSQTFNYSVAARNYGIVIHCDVTIGYDIPWRQVQELLIEAAIHTDGIAPTPVPFVLVRGLSDFYICYQINAYTDKDLSMPGVYSDLYKNIIDLFNEAGIEIMSPHFYAARKGDDTMIPPEYIKK